MSFSSCPMIMPPSFGFVAFSASPCHLLNHRFGALSSKNLRCSDFRLFLTSSRLRRHIPCRTKPISLGTEARQDLFPSSKNANRSSQTRMQPLVSSTTLTSGEVSVESLTPMMRHWVEVKRKYPNFLILYRVGDFFETFFEDSHVFAEACDLVLTAKDAGKALGARVPMAGIPHHTVDEKCRTLLANSLNVAIVDQVEPSSAAAPGALVRRAVTRLITPGTLVDDALLDISKPNYLACVSVLSWRATVARFGLAFVDVCTGEVRVTDCEGLDALENILRTHAPAELLIPAGSTGRLPKSVALKDSSTALKEGRTSGTSESHSERAQEDQPTGRKGSGANVLVAAIADTARSACAPVLTGRPIDDFRLDQCVSALCSHFSVDSVESLGLRQRDELVSALGAAIKFLSETFQIDGQSPVPLSHPVIFSSGDCLQLDRAALQNLEVVDTLRSGTTGKSLRWAVDRTVTAMGARRVRSWLLAPLRHVEDIMYRQRIVSWLVQNEGLRCSISHCLRRLADLERLAGRVGGGRASPRELQRLAQSLIVIPEISNALCDASSCRGTTVFGEDERSPFEVILAALDPGQALVDLGENVPVEPLSDIGRVIMNALVDPAPSVLPTTAAVLAQNPRGSVMVTDGSYKSFRIFQEGYCSELDALRASEADPTLWISAFEQEEQLRTGIPTLRVRRLRTTGYAVRVSRSIAERKLLENPTFFSSLGYERTLSTKAEIRFKSNDLTKLERDEQSIRTSILFREVELYTGLLERMRKLTSRIRAAAAGLAELDALAGFASVSNEWGYVAPELADMPCRELNIVDGRHPVVEQTLSVGKTFVPNSFLLGSVEHEIVRNDDPLVPQDGETLLRSCDEMILCGPNASFV